MPKFHLVRVVSRDEDTGIATVETPDGSQFFPQFALDTLPAVGDSVKIIMNGAEPVPLQQGVGSPALSWKRRAGDPQNVADGTLSVLTPDTSIQVNPDISFDAGSTWTLNSTGIWIAYANVEWDSDSGGDRLLEFFLNESVRKVVESRPAASGSADVQSGSIPLHNTSTLQVQVRVRQSSGGTLGVTLKDVLFYRIST